MDIRITELSDELSRAGDIFVTLHTNPYNGMSYVRTIPKDLIIAIRSSSKYTCGGKQIGAKSFYNIRPQAKPIKKPPIPTTAYSCGQPNKPST